MPDHANPDPEAERRRKAALCDDIRLEIMGAPAEFLGRVKRVWMGEHLTPEVIARLTDDAVSVLWFTDRVDGQLLAGVEFKLPGSASLEKLTMLSKVPPLMTGLRWATLSIKERIAVFKDEDLPLNQVVKDDIFDVLPPASRDYLAAWQSFINDGTCWLLAGRFGHQAHELLRDGFLLWSRLPVFNAYGMEQPTRDGEIPGAAGTPAFVGHMMGQRYGDWIAAVT